MNAEEYRGALNLAFLIIGAIVYHLFGLKVTIVVGIIASSIIFLLIKNVNHEDVVIASTYYFVYSVLSIISNWKVATFIVVSSVIFTVLDE